MIIFICARKEINRWPSALFKTLLYIKLRPKVAVSIEKTGPQRERHSYFAPSHTHTAHTCSLTRLYIISVAFVSLVCSLCARDCACDTADALLHTHSHKFTRSISHTHSNNVRNVQECMNVCLDEYIYGDCI